MTFRHFLYMLAVLLVTNVLGCDNDKEKEKQGNGDTVDENGGRAVDKSPTKEESERAKFEKGTTDYLAITEETTSVLASITDVESAKKAIPKLEEISKKGDELNDRMKPLGQPSEETEKYLEGKYRAELERVMNEMFDQMDRLKDDQDVWPVLEAALNNIGN